MEQLELQLEPIWDVGATNGFFTHYSTASAPALKEKKKKIERLIYILEGRVEEPETSFRSPKWLAGAHPTKHLLELQLSPLPHNRLMKPDATYLFLLSCASDVRIPGYKNSAGKRPLGQPQPQAALQKCRGQKSAQKTFHRSLHVRISLGGSSWNCSPPGNFVGGAGQAGPSSSKQNAPSALLSIRVSRQPQRTACTALGSVRN